MELLEWFRVDRSQGTRRLLVLGAGLVFVGASLVGGAFLTHREPGRLTLVVTSGAALLAMGLVVAFGGMAVLLAHDEYLAIRADGIVFHGGRGGEVVIAWSDLDRLALDEASGGWRALLADGTTHLVSVRYGGASPAALVAHLEHLKMKARLGPLDAVEVARVAIGLPYRGP